MADQSELAQWLSSAVREFCTAHGTAMHLPLLGNQFRSKFKKSFQEACNDAGIPPPVSKLAPFIQTFCRDLELLSYDDDLLERAAVRPSNMPHLSHPANTPASPRPREKAQRYVRAFWTAFIKEVAEKKRRVLYTEPSIWFDDVPEAQELGAGQLEIPREFIVTPKPGEAVSNAQVQQKIEAWMSRNQLKPERFIRPETLVELRQHATKTSLQHTHSRVEITQRFLGLLPDDMKKRFQIPADIVEFLLSVPK